MSDFRSDISLSDILLSDGVPLSTTAPTDETWYSTNGLYFGFQNASVISQYFRESNPVPNITTRNFPRSDGQFAEVAQYKVNTISIAGTIQAADRASMEVILDQMKKVCSPLLDKGGTLKLTLAGAARYFDNCYPSSSFGTMYEGRDYYHVLYCPFKISFESYEPYGRDGTRNVYNGGSVTANVSFPLTNTGSAPSQLVATMTVITHGTLSQVVFTNLVTGKTMTVASNFANGDVLEINGETKTVTINGVNVDFSGTFVDVAAGDNMISTVFTGTGFTVGLTGQSYPRYY